MPPNVSSALAAGQVFHGRYQIVRCLKSGGMGAVYECIHLKTRKRRALKVMLPEIVASAGMRERFELEARVTADIESEHIAETFDAGVDEETGAPFLVMELLRGEDLGGVLKQRGALPFEEVVLLLFQAALALDRTHAAGIVHRDLKPDNLFLTTRDDGAPRLKILDFGVAKVVVDEARSNQQTIAIGTPLYMSPEQFRGDATIGPRADVYALGHIAYTLLTGRPYWYDEQCANPATFALFVLVMAGPPERPSKRAARRGVTLSSGFDAWFARAIAVKARDRFESASALVTELAAVLNVAMPRFSLTSSPRISSLPLRDSPPARISIEPVALTAPTRAEVVRPTSITREASLFRGVKTTADPVPIGHLERDDTTTVANLASGRTEPGLPPKRSRLRILFLVPATALVIWIGVMVLLRTTHGDAVSSATASSASAISSAAGSGAVPAAQSPATSASAPSTGAPLSAESPPNTGAPMSTGAPLSTGAPSRTGPTVKQPLSPPGQSTSSVSREARAGDNKKPVPEVVSPQPPAPDCNPPYTVDEMGHRHVKQECN